ncbi:MgtC/SapB family protein [Afifella sp. IM 167]|uniref:MgtC/SapB family protein n=1 Tax=Afifella sp. IM 167 TaxID=2033586 RepID=UPI001CCE926E|nr:MgtC/SapB family protein [Afifella sp. IM 167]MBZ8132908.1 hypothetical protein [Afifella sp. IM 167]
MLEGLWQVAEPTHLPMSAIAGRLALAALLGSLLGFEREWRDKPAGLRTHMVTALAAATFAVLSCELIEAYRDASDVVRSDPIRLIEAVTSGVAFLAAGVILHARGHVSGLTTGAGMWLAGAIGTAVGLGHGLIAALATAIGLFIIIVLRNVSAAVSEENGGKGRDGVS